MPISPFRPCMSASLAQVEVIDSAVDSSVGSPVDGDVVDGHDLDCYPYTFSPLLLFSQEGYFDKGYSNYHSVAQFFSAALSVNMMENVLYDRKNMLYEELLNLVTSQKMFVYCCIDSHCTAFQVLGPHSLVYYDPLRPCLMHVSSPDAFRRFALYLLLKCSYGDSQHIQENKNYYTGRDSNPTRQTIYDLWRNINKLGPEMLGGIRSTPLGLNLGRYLLVNDMRDPKRMSTQETGNTCYFQTYIFAILCKVGGIAIARDGNSIDVQHPEQLEECAVRMSRFLLEFFVHDESRVLRPLTNSNVILDFFRYQDAAYYAVVTRFLQAVRQPVPDYKRQYRQMLEYFKSHIVLHTYSKFQLCHAMASTLNTKSLQPVCDTDGGIYKLGRSHYYKFRSAQLIFGFNCGITKDLSCFAEFNSLRKNQLLARYDELQPLLSECVAAKCASTKYRDYYFMAQFEVGQPELVQLHHYTYEIDLYALQGRAADNSLGARVRAVNAILAADVFFSKNNSSDYDKFMTCEQFQNSKKFFEFFLSSFMSAGFFQEFSALGFAQINLKEKDINALTRSAIYSSELMARQAWRTEHDFEKECLNQMARSTLRGHQQTFSGTLDMAQKYAVAIKIGHGFTYSKYNTLMHFLNVAEAYWHNPDLNAIQLFGKDIRAVLAISCQKIFFEEGHTFFHYGPIEVLSSSSYGRTEMDLQAASPGGGVPPYVSRDKRGSRHTVVVTERVYEHSHLRRVLLRLFGRADGVRFKSDDVVLNLALLSLMLDFGLCERHAGLLNLPFLQSLHRIAAATGSNKAAAARPASAARLDTRQLQVEVSNWLHEFDKKNTQDSVTRGKVEELLFEVSYKFIVNKNFNVRSKIFELIRQLNADPVYQQYVLLCKVYMSLCQINKSAEVDYYKVRCNNDYRILIPHNFSKATSDYLDSTTKRYTFVEREGIIIYDDLPLFDVRAPQPEIHLYRVRFDAAPSVQSMVKYIEVDNAFRSVDSESQYLIFIADSALHLDVGSGGSVSLRINRIPVEIATVWLNEATSFVPCFKYVDSEDMIFLTSRNIQYLVDKAGQFNENYYGMKHELIDCIILDQVYVDLNDEHVFKSFKLSELLSETKTVLYSPDYLLQVQGQQQLIDILDLAISIRSLSLFILVLFYLRRASLAIEFVEREERITKIAGPWKAAIQYVLSRATASGSNPHYDQLFMQQFFDLNQHERMPLRDFIDVLCANFTRYQRCSDGVYQIVPTEKQKRFLERIITAQECFHFSEVGSGKTKVILPLLCQAFLSNNAEAHQHLSRGGEAKHVMVILVPEHLVSDARAQIFRYCLNLNFADEYRIYDDIFALLHDEVHFRGGTSTKRYHSGSMTGARRQMKQIFITSFNQFKKSLTYDKIGAKVRPYRERMLVVADEVDDFLDRDKLVFNICSNKANAFAKPTIEAYFEVSRSAYRCEVTCPCPVLETADNAPYWEQLHAKFTAVHSEIQERSKSINKSFGIFNEKSLRHCSSNIAQDIEGYKSLIARPYESVNRAMPGSYYSDVERTIYLTYYILMEDMVKYDELFQQERKFISFEYYSSHVRHVDYDDLVYGSSSLSALVIRHPEIKDGLTRFLFEIILRRMEIRDRSRSVNSIDVVFNFDCIGFTGTPFIDNYPTFAYIAHSREDDIPDLIDRSFYAYASENLSRDQLAERILAFQGANSSVYVQYVPSDFMRGGTDELDILRCVLEREAPMGSSAGTAVAGSGAAAAQALAAAPPDGAEPDLMHSGFNVIVDLCGTFKRASIFEVRDVVRAHFGPSHFHYIYHIDQADGGDRVLDMHSDNDVQYDDEFYKYLCKAYGASLREKVFFFIDNRNVIGKDIPFQLVYQSRFSQPLFFRSVVLAHDVIDFSKIWQAMGRSRTMNATRFTIFTNQADARASCSDGGMCDLKSHALTGDLYVRNCDSKVAGNLSSIYQTLVSLSNLSHDRFYYVDEIVNVFLEKLEKTIEQKVEHHQRNLMQAILDVTVPCGILTHILGAKFKRSARAEIAAQPLQSALVRELMLHIVTQKYEQRVPSGNVFDVLLAFLSGEQETGTMEISYTKEQQKQKQKQHSKDQDADTMEVFDRRHQVEVTAEMDDYFAYTKVLSLDAIKSSLTLPVPVPIFQFSYSLGDGSAQEVVSLFPTVQFLYSHHIRPEYITKDVKEFVMGTKSNSDAVCARIFQAADAAQGSSGSSTRVGSGNTTDDRRITTGKLNVEVLVNCVRQNPQYTLAALRRGVYIIGMKDQFNVHDLPSTPLHDHVQYVADELGFVLFDRSDSHSVDRFGPYFIEQYLIMEALSKQEVAQNVLDYYVNHKERLERGVQNYGEVQGKGFICWRFIAEFRGPQQKQEQR